MKRRGAIRTGIIAEREGFAPSFWGMGNYVLWQAGNQGWGCHDAFTREVTESPYVPLVLRFC